MDHLHEPTANIGWSALTMEQSQQLDQPARPSTTTRTVPSNLSPDEMQHMQYPQQEQEQQMLHLQHRRQSIDSCIPGSAEPTVKRRRLRPMSTLPSTKLFHKKSIPSILLFIHLPFLINFLTFQNHPLNSFKSSIQSPFPFASAYTYVVTWNNGPEDNYFCGTKWDDPQPCSERQNCRSGKHEECMGFADGEQCFAFTSCDTKSGGGHDFVWIDPINDPPSGMPTNSPYPTGPPNTPEPTKIPTEFPIEPPPPLSDRSPDPTDHWFCGIGIDDTNQKCGVHCPSASECPMGEICYFGTKCDARTHAPTPPPTRRPTDSPTPYPTGSPTVSYPPSNVPSNTVSPSAPPTMPQPTRSPTKAPTKQPTWSPLTEVQSEMFCGLSWQDVTSKCRERCPTGEDTECPEGFQCFAYTGCREENGYPEEEYQHLNGHGDESTDEDGDDNASEETASEEVEPCVSFEVTITPDNWPQETSWQLTNAAGEIVLDDGDVTMTKGEPTNWLECIPRRQCYEFKIMDSGGDGLCCNHGEGNYKVDFDGELVKVGAVFYDDEEVEVGVCGETAAPTKAETGAPTAAPTIKKVIVTKAPTEAEFGNSVGDPSLAGGVSPSGKGFRCIPKQLADSGYKVAANQCDKFDDCYNEWIEAGDSWFCDDASQCVETAACGSADEGNGDTEKETGNGGKGNADESTSRSPTPSPTRATATRPKRPTPKPTAALVTRPLRPTPNPTPLATRPMRPVVVITPRPTQKPTISPTSSATGSPITSDPTVSPSGNPTYTPTLSPTTLAPTMGPCDGEPCNNGFKCRSQYGFCGSDELYCNENTVWSEDCGTKDPVPSPTLAPMSAATQPPMEAKFTNPPVSFATANSPTQGTVSATKPSYSKPSGGGKPKPNGGKVPSSPRETSIPVPTYAPQSNAPTVLSTWIIFKEPSQSPTPAPIAASGEDENYIVLNSSDSLTMEIITNSPTAAVQASSSIETVQETDDNEEGSTKCSGEPCPVASHCRSRYGSCGPGFIYCNQYTIWTSSCPVKPTKKPTSRPTKSPSATKEEATKEPVAAPTVAKPANNEPTLPTLPKPTMPFITDPIPFEVLPEFSSAAHSIAIDGVSKKDDVGDSNDDDADDDDDVKDDDEEEEDPEKDTSSTGFFSSNEYLAEWRRSNSAFAAPKSLIAFGLQAALLANFSVMFVLY